MAFEADTVVVELVAKVDNYDGKVKASATNFDQAVRKIGKAGADAERVLENLRNKLQAALAAGNTQQATKIAANIRKIEEAANAAAASTAKVKTAVDSQATAVGQAADREIRSRNRAAQESAKAANLITQRSRMLGFQISDIGTQLSSGASPFIVLAQQGPQVANALDGVKGRLGTVATFLSGPWGAALLAATTILGGFLLKNRDTTESLDDLVQKLKENAEKAKLSSEAQDIFADTLEGVTKALDDNEKALKNLNDENETAARQALEAAAAQKIRLIGIRAETAALVDQARALLEIQRARASGPTQAAEIATLGIADRQKTLDRLEASLAKTDEAITRAEGQIQEALSRRVVEMSEEMSDPLNRINKKYDDLIGNARKLAVANGTVTSELRKQVDALNAQREAELKLARERESNKKGQSGRQITEAEARSIVAGIGGTVTSGTRSAAHNRAVGGVPGSFHLKGRALDIAKTAGITLDKIVRAFEAKGVSLIEKLDEGDHFHVAWRNRANEDAERAAMAELNRRQAFENELASLQEDERQARLALITSAEQIAALEMQAVDAAHDQYEDEVKHGQEIGKLREGEAVELLKINDERAKLAKELIQRREDERKFRMEEEAARRQADLQDATLRSEEEVLQSRQQLATTAKERHELERRLIDLQFQEERLRNQYIIDWAARVQANKDATEKEKADAELAAKIAKMRQGTLPERQGNAQTGNDVSNATPLQSFFESIPDTADEINAALEDVAVHGLQTFTDALTDAIVNFRSLGDVGRAVLQALTADLVKMAIQQVLLRTVGKVLGKAAVAETAVEAGAAAAAWAPAAALASLATLGTNAGPAAAAIAGTVALAHAAAIPGFESGGFTGSGSRKRVAGLVHKNEYVFDADATRRIGVPTLDALAEGRTIAPSKARAARGGGAGADITSLRSIISEAVNAGLQAMPDVNLYASLDPPDVLQRALGTPAGSKAVLAFLNANSGAVKASLNRPS